MPARPGEDTDMRSRERMDRHDTSFHERLQREKENPKTEAREGLCGSQHYAYEDGVLKYPSKRLVAGDEEQRRHDLKNAVLEVLNDVDPKVTGANLTRCCALRVLHSQRRSPGTGSDSSACLNEK